MDKLTYSEIQTMRQKDLEHLLWEVFWSYSKELGLDGSEDKKEEMVERASKMIPEFAKSSVDLELYFDYPVIYLFLTSLHLMKNFLESEEIQPIMAIEGADNNSKLALVVAGLKDKGIAWQQSH